jgi:hypothetical protein
MGRLPPSGVPAHPPTDPHDEDFEDGDGPPLTGPVPENIDGVGDDVGDVDADFGGGYDCGDVPDNIHTD